MVNLSTVTERKRNMTGFRRKTRKSVLPVKVDNEISRKRFQGNRLKYRTKWMELDHELSGRFVNHQPEIVAEAK